mgnify:FL=1
MEQTKSAPKETHLGVRVGPSKSDGFGVGESVNLLSIRWAFEGHSRFVHAGCRDSDETASGFTTTCFHLVQK